MDYTWHITDDRVGICIIFLGVETGESEQQKWNSSSGSGAIMMIEYNWNNEIGGWVVNINHDT